MLATLEVMTMVEDEPPATILQDSFFIRNNYTLIRVRVKDVWWVHADGNYCYVVTSEKKYIVKSSLKKLLSRLPVSLFVQIHKGYVVQIECIEKVDIKENVVMVCDTPLPLGRIYKEQLLENLDII